MPISDTLLMAVLVQLKEVYRDARLAGQAVSPSRHRNEVASLVASRLADKELEDLIWQDVPPEVLAYRKESV